MIEQQAAAQMEENGLLYRHGGKMAVLLVSLFTVILLVVFNEQARLLANARHLVEHGYEVSSQIDKLHGQLMDVHAGVHAKAVDMATSRHGNSKVIAEVPEGDIKASIERLQKLVSDNAMQQENLDAWEVAILDYLDHVKAHEQEEELLLSQPYHQKARKLIAHSSQQMQKMKQEENALLQRRINMDNEHERHNRLLMLSAIALFYVSMIGAICTVMHHWRKARQMEQRAHERSIETARSRAFLKNILDHVADPIFVKDSQHRFIDGNKALWQLMGREETQVLGRTDYDFFPQSQADVFWQKDELVLNTGQSNINVETLTDANGEHHTLSTKKASFTMPDGTPVLVGVIRDITELRRMQEQLKESDEQRLKSIMDHCGMPVYIKDLDGRYLQLNRSFLELGDFDEMELLGKTDYDIFPARYADVFRENDLQVQRQRSAMEFEEIAPQADGDHTYVTVKFPLYDAVGQLYAICGISTDITERKRMEAKLLRYTHELERSNQELDDFAYIASHDLKEPLRGLFNHASFLMEDYGDKLDADGVHRLQRLSQLCQRMEALVNDLLYFSRLGRTQLAVQEVNLNAVVDEISQMMESTLKERKAKIALPRKLPRVTCDRPRMTEVFRNLITNAVKYNDKKAPKVEVGYLDEPDMGNGRKATVFYVKDNGLGIEPGFHQEIFRIFKRLQPVGAGEASGTGVGLTFVKKIVERHGGRVWLESQPGKGSIFYFTILNGEETHDGA